MNGQVHADDAVACVNCLVGQGVQSVLVHCVALEDEREHVAANCDVGVNHIGLVDCQVQHDDAVASLSCRVVELVLATIQNVLACEAVGKILVADVIFNVHLFCLGNGQTQIDEAVASVLRGEAGGVKAGGGVDMDAVLRGEVVGQCVGADLLVPVFFIGLAFADLYSDNTVTSVLCLEGDIVNLSLVEHLVPVFVAFLQIVRADHLVVG